MNSPDSGIPRDSFRWETALAESNCRFPPVTPSAEAGALRERLARAELHHQLGHDPSKKSKQSHLTIAS